MKNNIFHLYRDGGNSSGFLSFFFFFFFGGGEALSLNVFEVLEINTVVKENSKDNGMFFQCLSALIAAPDIPV